MRKSGDSGVERDAMKAIVLVAVSFLAGVACEDFRRPAAEPPPASALNPLQEQDNRRLNDAAREAFKQRTDEMDANIPPTTRD